MNKELKSQLNDEFHKYISRIADVTGYTSVGRLINDESYPETASLSGIDITKFDIYEHIEWIDAYTNHAEFRIGHKKAACDEAFACLYTLYTNNDTNYPEIESPMIEGLWNKSRARARVDNARIRLGPKFCKEMEEEIGWVARDKISIDDIALLCGMTPASVRNSTTKNSPDRLQTYRSGKSTFIDPDSLFPWLDRRRGYVPTKVIRTEKNDWLNFSDIEELGLTIIAMANHHTVSLDTLSTILNITDPAIGSTGIDVLKLNIDDLVNLSKLFKIENSSFVVRANKLILDHKLRSSGLSTASEIGSNSSRKRSGNIS